MVKKKTPEVVISYVWVEGDEENEEIDEQLESGKDYTVEYANNINASDEARVIITGIGDYFGTVEKTYTINKRSISDEVFTLLNDEFVYEGMEIKPVVYSKNLELDKDYSVEYVGNNSVGDAYVVIKGINNYTGEKSIPFTIKDNGNVDPSIDNPTDGNKQDDNSSDNTTSKTTEKVEDNKSKDDTAEIKTTVKLSKVKIKSATKKIKGKKVTIKLSKKLQKEAVGIVIRVYDSKSDANKINKNYLAKKFTINNRKIYTITSKKLKDKKNIYVRVRAYRIVDGVKKYGKWSTVKKVKTY